MADNINDKLYDIGIKRQIAVQRYAKGLNSQVQKRLNPEDIELIKNIRLRLDNITERGAFLSKANRQRKEDLRTYIKSFNLETVKVFNNDLKQELISFAKEESDHTYLTLQNNTSPKLKFAKPPASIFNAIVTAIPFEGRVLKDWTSQWGAAKSQRIWAAIQIGLLEGMSEPEITDMITGTKAKRYKDGVINTSRRGAQTLVLTSAAHVNNQARDSVYRANSDMIKSEVWSSVFDRRTSTICASRDGMEFPLGKGPRPPAHPRCFLRSNTKIYTAKGWKRIIDIKVGDQALTHKGRFKPVTELLFEKRKVQGNVVEIAYGHKKKSILVTEEHPILTQRGWVNAGDIKDTDIITMLSDDCNEQYKFSNFKPLHIRKFKYYRNEAWHYNFSVKDDESYIADGFVVHNCRSVMVPVFKSGTAMGYPELNKMFTGKPAPRKTYAQWLKGQKVPIQNDVLGVAKAKAWREGKIPLGDFVDESGKEYTLKELKLST